MEDLNPTLPRLSVHLRDSASSSSWFFSSLLLSSSGSDPPMRSARGPTRRDLPDSHGPRDRRRIAVAHVARAALLQLVQHTLERVREHLNAREPMRIERRIVRAPRRTARHLQHRVEVVAHHAPAPRLTPLARDRQRTILRPHAQWKREGPHAIAGDHGVDRQHPARDLLLHHRVAVLPQVRMPERVSTELESLLREKADLLEPPRRLLSGYPLLAKERMTCGSGRQHAEGRLVSPIRMLAMKRQPDSDRAVRIYHERPILVDVAELRRARVIEREHHRR